VTASHDLRTLLFFLFNSAKQWSAVGSSSCRFTAVRNSRGEAVA